MAIELVKGKRGFTNTQMIPAMKEALAQNDNEALLELNKNHSMVFANSFRYLKKEEKEKLVGIIGFTPESKVVIPEVNGQPIVEKGKRSFSNAQLIPKIKSAVDENDTETLKTLQQVLPSVFESSVKYIGKERQEKLKTIMEAK